MADLRPIQDIAIQDLNSRKQALSKAISAKEKDNDIVTV